MPLDGTIDDIEADFETLEAIGAHIDGLIDKLLVSGALQKTLRRWLVGHVQPPEEHNAQACLTAMAADLEFFTPSMSGRTMLERHLSAQSPGSSTEQLACRALAAAHFRLVRIVRRESPDLVRVKDLVTEESLLLLDARISPTAAGLTTAMRLCPLASGRHVLISPRFAMDDAMLEGAMTFVQRGRLLGHGHRCAANLYKSVARRGFRPLPRLIVASDREAFGDFRREAEERLTPIERLALRWIQANEVDADLVFEARRLATVDNLVDAFGLFGQIHADEHKELRAAYEQIAAVQVETIVQRAQVGVDAAATLDRVGAEIAGHIARGHMEAGAYDLFDRMRRRWTRSEAKRSAADAASATADIEMTRIKGVHGPRFLDVVLVS